MNGYDYGTATVASFDGASVRIWYTTTGPHAVDATTTRSDGVPDNVATAAKVADAALAYYQSIGFSPPISDGGSGTSCGGSPALDLYLMHFNAADGDTATENCTPKGKAMTCSTFGQVEAKLESIYGTFERGAHVVIAHELFHSVQDAYDAKLDRFWAEGTAQWGAKSADPTETDLESFLPAFFKSAGQSIDTSTGGVVADFLYASAIWPVFLTEHVGPDAVRKSLEEEMTMGPPSMAAIAAALPSYGTTLADTYPVFMAWNAATGARAGTGGYKSAKTYPELTLTALGATGASGIITGYSAFFYSFDFAKTDTQISISADTARVGARAFPLVSGQAQLDKLTPLPAVLSDKGVVVVTGISSKKSDAPFTLTLSPAPTTSDAGTGGTDAATDGGTSTATTNGSGGCATYGASTTHQGPLFEGLAALAAMGFLRSRKRRYASPLALRQR